MKIVLSIFSLLVFICLNSESKAQVSTNTELNEKEYFIRDSASYFSEANFVGTYQIIHRSKEREVFTKEFYFQIESRRSDTDVIMWDVSPLTTVRIFPKNMTFPPNNYRVSDSEIVEIID